MSQGRVSVYGGDMTRRPLCDSEDAKLVIIRNASGSPTVILARLNGDTWGLVTPEDRDWEAMCVRFGLLNPPPVQQIISGSH